jgi:hypothetical protein
MRNSSCFSQEREREREALRRNLALIIRKGSSDGNRANSSRVRYRNRHLTSARSARSVGAEECAGLAARHARGRVHAHACSVPGDSLSLLTCVFAPSDRMRAQ